MLDGRHVNIRIAEIYTPLIVPYFAMDSFAYSEQLGEKRHTEAVPNIFFITTEILYWYIVIRAKNMYLIKNSLYVAPFVCPHRWIQKRYLQCFF